MNSFPESCSAWIGGIFIVFWLTANYFELRKYAAALGIPVAFSLHYAISAMILPLLCLCVPFFAIYKKIVEIILSIKYGSKFGGLLTGVDAYLYIQEKNVSAIETFCIIKYKCSRQKIRAFCDAVKETLGEKLLTEFRKEPKSFGIIQESLGYMYILKDEVPFEDCFKLLKEVDSPTGEITKADLRNLLDEIAGIPLGKDSKSLWEVLVGTQPIKWKSNNEDVKYYPIIFRFSHALTDAVHLAKAVMAMFSDKEFLEYVGPEELGRIRQYQLKYDGFLRSVVFKFKFVLYQCYAAIVAPAIIYVTYLTQNINAKVNFRSTTPENRFVRSFRGEESPRHVATVKRIKRKFPGAAFEDVLLTAFTAGLSECFKKGSQPIPEHLITVASRLSNLTELLEIPAKGQIVPCATTALFRLCKLPIGIASEGTYSSLVNTLESIKKQRMLSDNTSEFLALRFLNNVAHVIPTTLIAMSTKNKVNYPIIFTNLPPTPEITVMDGCVLQDFAPIIHAGSTGNCISSVAHGGRQFLGLVLDKVLVSDQNEMEALIERIYKALHMLEQTTPQE